MSQSTLENQCPDCGGGLTAIKLFGRGWENPVSGAAIDAEVVHYAEADAVRSTFKSMFTETGTVRATLCGECRRIFLHGDPK